MDTLQGLTGLALSSSTLTSINLEKSTLNACTLTNLTIHNSTITPLGFDELPHPWLHSQIFLQHRRLQTLQVQDL
jgi:hypothetical protein